jgi:competence protein ComQ
MWLGKLSYLLKQEIESILDLLPVDSGLVDIARECLSQPGRGLSANLDPDHPWQLLPLIVCQSVCRKYAPALPVAASLQFMLAAGDVFDDIEDADSPTSITAKYGQAAAINTGTTLIILAEKAICRLKNRKVDVRIISQFFEILNSHFTLACLGQHYDLINASKLTISEEEYLKITALKSASQIECSCRLGALLGGADKKLIDIFSKFGHNLGMSAQLANDIRGINRGKDILNRKVTLPVIYALNQMEGQKHQYMEAFFRKETSDSVKWEDIKDWLSRCGAVYYASVKQETYKQQALAYLITAKKLGVDTSHLTTFLKNSIAVK